MIKGELIVAEALGNVPKKDRPVLSVQHPFLRKVMLEQKSEDHIKELAGKRRELKRSQKHIEKKQKNKQKTA